MLTRSTIIFLHIFLTWSTFVLHAQTPNSSREPLSEYSYQDLADRFYEHEGDSARAVVYAHEYLRRASSEKDKVRMADGYYFNAILNTGARAIEYADSIVRSTKDTLTSFYPTTGYLIKGAAYYERRDMKQALDNYLKANRYAEEAGNESMEISVKFSLGLLKYNIGHNKEALELLRECYHRYVVNGWDENPSAFMPVLLALSEAYLRNEILDSSLTVSSRGYVLAEKNKDTLWMSFFKLDLGIHKYLRGEYAIADKLLTSSLEILEKEHESTGDVLINGYYYLGKTKSARGYTEDALKCYKKVDSVFGIQQYAYPDVREGYEALIKHYRSQKDVFNHLLYVEKLLRFDSIVNKNYIYLSSNIHREYDMQNLQSQRDRLKTALIRQEAVGYWWKYGLLGVVVLFSIVLSFYYQKQKRYKDRFHQLLKKVPQEESPPPTIIQPQNKEISADMAKVGVTTEIMEIITAKLKRFEEREGFLQAGLTLHTLSKSLKTNTTYLSKVVNAHTGKSFSNYINDLRIAYVVERLKTDERLRGLMVVDIGKEIGFGNANSFSKAFYEHTGIYPSYYIRMLEKETKKAPQPKIYKS